MEDEQGRNKVSARAVPIRVSAMLTPFRPRQARPGRPLGCAWPGFSSPCSRLPVSRSRSRRCRLSRPAPPRWPLG